MSAPFCLSIETAPGVAHQHGYHLGTDEKLARQIAEETYAARVKHGLPVVTVALMRDRKMVACYGGQWFDQEAQS